MRNNHNVNRILILTRTKRDFICGTQYIGGTEQSITTIATSTTTSGSSGNLTLCFCDHNFTIIPRYFACQRCTSLSPRVKLLERFGDYKKRKNACLTSSSHVIYTIAKQQVMSRRGYRRRTTTKCAKNKTRSCKALRACKTAVFDCYTCKFLTFSCRRRHRINGFSEPLFFFNKD